MSDRDRTPQSAPPSETARPVSAGRTITQLIGLFGGVIVFVGVLLAPAPDGVSAHAWVVAALAGLMVVWWVTEAIPIAGTALLPLVVLPMAGIMPLKQASAAYMNTTVVLLMAGFILARGIEKWSLHERIALMTVNRVGSQPTALIGGFMAAALFLSMWISNTATTLMMTPIALSVATAVEREGAVDRKFAAVLLLGVAYSASIGGLGTPVGSPTNLIVIGYLADQGIEVSFSDWMRLGLPVVLILGPLAWMVLSFFGARSGAYNPSAGAAAKKAVRAALDRLGPTSTPEWRTLGLFAVVASAWVLRGQLQKVSFLEGLSDPLIAVAGAIAFFIVPSGASKKEGAARSTPLLDWKTAEQIPWGVVLLFGGGLSLAGAMTTSGLAENIATALGGLTQLPLVMMVFALTVLVLGLTEVTSNVATASAIMPVVGAVAIQQGVDPLLLAAPVGLAASCAFMLPMATGPNAVAYATGRMSIARMARIGLWVNILGALTITGVVSVLAPSGG